MPLKGTATASITEEQRAAFIDELAEVCKRHGLSLSHQDTQGSFIVEKWEQQDEDWLKQAYVSR